MINLQCYQRLRWSPKSADSSNQKQIAAYARKARRFPCLPATARDGELINMHHSYHHVDTRRHPNSSYVTTKLYGTSTCGCNNNTIVSESAICMLPTVDVCRARWPGSGEALLIHAKLERWRHCGILYISCSKLRFYLSIVSNIMSTNLQW